MELIQVSENLNDYLACAEYSDYNQPIISQKCRELFQGCKNETDIIRTAFLFVRDNISHSWDIGSHQINISAQDVLRNGHALCHAKANLLAAMLRFEKIPTGFCYQRLTIGDTPDTGFCLHGMNAVLQRETGKWMRIDARGNKPGIDAQYIPGREQLAFPVRPEFTEEDYPFIYSQPLPCVINAMQSYSDCLELYLHGLPAEIPADEMP